MREIYLLNNGDSLKKIGITSSCNDIKIAEDRLFGYRYAITKSGTDDIILVKNYLPAYVYTLKKEDNYLDILARGFKIEGSENITKGDTIILKKPNSIRYVVSPLESIDDVCYKFGIDKKDLMINNQLKTEKLFVGQILWI